MTLQSLSLISRWVAFKKVAAAIYVSSPRTFQSAADPGGVRGSPSPFETKLFHFHGEFSESQEK